MLEQVDLKKKLSEADYHKQFPEVQRKLMDLQKQLWEAGVPVIIVFEGWDAAGKGSMISRLVNRLDPRNYKVYHTQTPTPDESMRPFLWRHWKRIPSRGRLAIFDRSWYGRVLVERIDKIIKKKDWRASYDEIKNFERQLTDDGYVIVKFWLHISKKEQKKRFKSCEADKLTAWKVEKEDWKHQKQYKQYYKAVEEMLAKTSTSNAPWTIVEATDRHWAIIKIFNAITEACLKGFDHKEHLKALAKIEPTLAKEKEKLGLHTHPTILDKLDLSKKLSEKIYRQELQKYQVKLRQLEHEIFIKRIPVVIALEGWDAAGKGGAIKRLVNYMDPRGYEVIPISAPNQEEKVHHFLWRFWNQIPKAGHITIYDRSWYGRVLVERVEKFCTETEWERAYQEINEFEEHLANFGTVVCKFWVQISEKEQLKRFKERKQTDYKRWKLTEEDWRNRSKRVIYEEAVIDMLERTSTSHAPWTVVEGEDKYLGRVKILKTAAEAIAARLGSK